MKDMARNLRSHWLILPAIIAGMMVSCTEEINTKDRFTVTEYTILSFLEHGKNASNYTEYVNLLHQVTISEQSGSTVAQLLATRGAYTCFAPNNKAIYDYLDSLRVKGIISSASWDGFSSEATLDSIRKVIVYNSVFDGTSSDKVLEMGEIMSQNDDVEFTLPNLNNRKIYKTHIDQTDSIFINGVSLIDLTNRDVKTINGRVHEIHSVIAPSNDTAADVFRQMIAEGSKGFMVMAKLIIACGLEDTLSKTQDDVWEQLYRNGELTDLPLHSDAEGVGSLPRHRLYGFTIFAESDAVWESLIGKSYDEIGVSDIKNYLIGKGAYPNATQDDDFTNENNIINQFVTYHILPEKLEPGKLVIHYTENGYSFKTKGAYSIPVFEYYTTMGKRRLLKIYQSKESQEEDTERSDGTAGIFLNRFPILKNGRGEFSDESDPSNNNYHESGKFKAVGSSFAMYDDENVGIKIRMDDGDGGVHQKLKNSCIYPLDRVLVYTENVQNRLASERIRIDMSAMFPELINNDIRCPMGPYPEDNTKTRGIPVDYQYLEGLQIREGTRFYYLSGYDRGWFNFQGDEFNIKGKYEFTMKLPPVPKEGHYEIRFAVSSNSQKRSMCQVYFGSDINYLPAQDIPMDLRIGFVYHHFKNGNQLSNFGYATYNDYKNEANVSTEEQDEITKTLRSRGFMKGPRYYHCGSTTDKNLAIQEETVTRRIMVSADMSPDKTYYIRFKNVLNDEDLQFYGDFLEFVSKDVYDNPVEPEDNW